MQPIADVPIRQLMRLLTEFFMSSHQHANRLLPGMLGTEFGAVARVCLPDWTREGVLAVPAETTQAISIRKIAASLRRSPETTRRRVGQLIERGLCTVSEDGVSIASTPGSEALVYLQGLHDLMLRLIADMHRTCDIELEVSAMPLFTVHDVIERSIDVLLRPIDTYRPLSLSPGAYLLWGALTGVAVRKVTFDPGLARLYANDIPPDEVRLDTSLLRLAAALSIPYSTAWRQMKELMAAGLVTRLGDDRWTVLRANLQDQTVRAAGEPPALFTLRMVRELAQLGLDPAKAERGYLAGRPAAADFGLG